MGFCRFEGFDDLLLLWLLACGLAVCFVQGLRFMVVWVCLVVLVGFMLVCIGGVGGIV